ncbi:calcium/sodium antiporter [Candidatus Parabeggiatoa sp. HSG14]|uniref:calcium/sodium antiporter n=1 Tax=Candidatus Parabeggiatoa sp. HSG14 TaxID=3055593 RepID=UPI0025A841FF|nr:calcium/sodium antiporter [Thiotrichales bacterium HSG14]
MDLITSIFFVLGFVLLGVGADLLVRGSANLAETLGISRLVVGLTIVAFGTSAPELAVNIQSAFADKPDLAVGNVVGSNILNILLVLGVAALITPLGIHKRLIRLEVPLMIGASVLLLFLAYDGLLNRWEGLFLFTCIVFYTIFAIKTTRQTAEQPKKDNFKPIKNGFIHILMQIFLVIVGLGLLVQGSNWLVDGAVELARHFGISELIIGLTIVSIGTSLPELATVIAASMRNEQELVVGNVVGSNLFNILMVLGLTSLIAPSGIAVSHEVIVFDMLIMIAVAFACLPIFFSGYRIERWEGGLFLAYYVIYMLYLFLKATAHPLLHTFNSVMLWLIPITVIMLLVIVWKSRKKVHQIK